MSPRTNALVALHARYTVRRNRCFIQLQAARLSLLIERHLFSDRNVQFKLSDYVDEEDEHMRNVLTPREYVTQMMITGFQRLHAAEGTQLGERSRLGVYPKKSRKDGVVRTWEARVTQSGIKVCCESAELGVVKKTSVSMQ